MFFPNSSPNVHLRHTRLCLHEYLNTVILCIFIGIALCWKCLYARASDESQCTLLRKFTIIDNCICLITILSVGIARRGLNELIFEKIPNLTKIDIFCFFCLKLKIIPCAFWLILPARVTHNKITPIHWFNLTFTVTTVFSVKLWVYVISMWWVNIPSWYDSNDEFSCWVSKLVSTSLISYVLWV